MSNLSITARHFMRSAISFRMLLLVLVLAFILVLVSCTAGQDNSQPTPKIQRLGIVSHAHFSGMDFASTLIACVDSPIHMGSI